MRNPLTSKHSSQNTSPRTASTPWFREIWFVLLLYLLASLFCGAYFMGDTVDYSQSIVVRAAGQDNLFWEFGHLLWRPLGFVLFKVFSPITSLRVGSGAQANATIVLISLSWWGGLVSVLSLYGILNRICQNRWTVLTTIVAFIFAQAFLNYLHTGAPYVPGLALLLLGTYVLIAQGGKDSPAPSASLVAGGSLAGG